jgi:S-adenosylmethionine:tRNA ribosyltransferase-isomerase
VSAVDIEPTERLEAHEPPEVRGDGRDDVRLLVSRRGDGTVEHAHFRDLPALLAPGDLLVLNTSATLPAALSATRGDGTALELHLSTPLPDGGDDWVVELRRELAPFPGGRPGETLALADGATVELLARYRAGPRLWVARPRLPEPVEDFLAAHGRPIRYRHVTDPRPLADYQTVYALDPGSAEMPSAGRAFTPETFASLAARGIGVASLVLHAGVSSLELGERPYPERFVVPAATAAAMGSARRAGGRVVAVGTTVVRALETTGGAAGAGWTDLEITPERGVHVVDALLTGWHDPDAPHLQMLEALAGRDLVERSYRAAAEGGYLWHEFGDLNLILP